MKNSLIGEYCLVAKACRAHSHFIGAIEKPWSSKTFTLIMVDSSHSHNKVVLCFCVKVDQLLIPLFFFLVGLELLSKEQHCIFHNKVVLCFLVKIGIPLFFCGELDTYATLLCTWWAGHLLCTFYQGALLVSSLLLCIEMFGWWESEGKRNKVGIFWSHNFVFILWL